MQIRPNGINRILGAVYFFIDTPNTSIKRCLRVDSWCCCSAKCSKYGQPRHVRAPHTKCIQNTGCLLSATILWDLNCDTCAILALSPFPKFKCVVPMSWIRSSHIHRTFVRPNSKNNTPNCLKYYGLFHTIEITVSLPSPFANRSLMVLLNLVISRRDKNV